MTRQTFLLTVGALLIGRRVGAVEDVSRLLVDIDAVLVAASGWDLPEALQREIVEVRRRIAVVLDARP